MKISSFRRIPDDYQLNLVSLVKFQSSQISDLHCSKLTPTSWKCTCTTHDLHESTTVLRPQNRKILETLIENKHLSSQLE